MFLKEPGWLFSETQNHLLVNKSLQFLDVQGNDLCTATCRGRGRGYVCFSFFLLFVKLLNKTSL